MVVTVTKLWFLGSKVSQFGTFQRHEWPQMKWKHHQTTTFIVFHALHKGCDMQLSDHSWTTHKQQPHHQLQQHQQPSPTTPHPQPLNVQSPTIEVTQLQPQPPQQPHFSPEVAHLLQSGIPNTHQPKTISQQPQLKPEDTPKVSLNTFSKIFRAKNITHSEDILEDK